MDQNLLNLFVETLKPATPAAPAAASAAAGGSPLEAALSAEGITGPLADLARSVYAQESSSGHNTKTSSAGAVGGMQIVPTTFREVADRDWDINDPVHNARAGVRYLAKMYERAGGDPALAAAGYYGGPGGLDKARKGVAVSDPRNPNAPNTLQYGAQVAARVKGGADPAAAPAAPARAQPAASRQQTWDDPYVTSTPREAPARSAMQAVADVVLGLGAGVATGVGMVAGAAGADNPVAQGAGDVSKSLTALQSPARQFQREMRQEEIRRAEASGSTLAEIAAYGGSFLEAPVETVLNAVGTSAPTLLVAMIPGLNQAAAAQFIVAGAMGAAQGAGAVKGQIYESVYQQLKKAGVGEEEAKKAAVGAQEYGGKNGEQILLGAGLGALAGTTGAEAAVGRVLGQRAAEKAKGYLSAIGGGVAREAPVEAVQGGQERLASNLALQNEGFDVPTTQGVAGQAVLEGMASAPMGGGMAAIEHATAPAQPQPQPVPAGLEPVAKKAAEGGTLSKAAMKGVEATTAAVQSAPAPVDPTARLAQLEQVAASGAMFSEQEQAEYQALKARKDATDQAAGRPDAASKAEAKVQAEEQQLAESLAQRSAAIAGILRNPGALQALRREDSPVTVQSVLNDLAAARSPSTDPGRREQALERLEMTLEWVGIQTAEKPTTYDNTAAAGQRAQAAAQQQSSNQEAAAKLPPQVEVDRVLEALRVEPALRSAEQTAAVQMAQSRYQPEDFALLQKSATYAAGLSATEKLRVQQLRGVANPALKVGRDEAAEIAKAQAAGQPSAPQPPRNQAAAPTIPHQGASAAPDKTGNVLPTSVRERRAQLRQVIDTGVNRLERRDDGFYLTDGKREFKLDNMGDAAMARAEIQASVDQKAARAKADPSDAQVEAYNFSKGEPVKVAPGVNFLTETKKGDTRRSKPGAKKPWQTVMKHHYGDIQGTKGADGDAVDAFWVGDGDRIFVIDQVNPETGKFDEHKVMLRARDEAAARQAYLGNYEKGWKGLGAITEMTHEEFKAWVHDREATAKPAAKDFDAGRSSGPVGAAVSPRGAGSRGDQQRGSVGAERAGGAGADGRVAGDGDPAAPARRSGADSPAPDAGRRPDVEVGTGPDNPETGAAPKKPKRRKPRLVTVDGENVEVNEVDIDGLSKDSPSRGGRSQKVTQTNAQIIQAIAKAFGKEVVFFRNPDDDLGDGFVMSGISTTIFINEDSTVNHLSVFGHELLHLLQQDMPKVHAILREMVRQRVKEGGRQKYRDYYHGKSDVHTDEELDTDDLSELTSDLGGEFLSSPQFWRDVMDRVQEQHPENAKGLIEQLAAKLFAMIDHLVAYFKKQYHKGFQASRVVDDLDSIRSAYEEALAGYMAAANHTVRQSKPRDVTDTPEFKRWFGDSKVVDAEGRPLVVYHGTNADFTVFDEKKATSATGNPLSKLGFFFAEDGSLTKDFGRWQMSLYLSIKNPLIVSADEFVSRGERISDDEAAEWKASAIETGHDGILVEPATKERIKRDPWMREFSAANWIAFSPEQIKSAIGNSGTFDPASPDITNSKPRISDEDARTMAETRKEISVLKKLLECVG